MSSKSFSYLVSVSHGSLVNPSTPTFPNIHLTKTMTIYLLFGKSLKKGCNDLYFHPFNFNLSSKTFSYLTSFSCRGWVNPSTPTFGNIDLTEIIIDLHVAWKFNSVKNGWNNVYLHSKPFKITLKPNSYLTSITHRGLVIPPTPTFCNIDGTQTTAYWFSQKYSLIVETLLEI